MIITFYELMGLIKDNKAPKKIVYDGKTYTWSDYSYWEKTGSLSLFMEVSAIPDIDIMNLEIEILEEYEKNDEWKDICELFNDSRYKFSNKQNGMTQEDRRVLDSNFDMLSETISQLIKNQKYLKKRLDKNENV